ncbi:hypothetical protein BH11ACT2_BH11ACT2_02370 [soil metagenome]
MTRVERDVVYATVLGFRPLALDLHLPETASADAPVPVIVFVHGGGWRRGSRSTMVPNVDSSQSFDRIVAAGFCLASIDYRLSGEAHFPAQLDDLRAALEWVRAEGRAHGLDASRIVLWGESAGATIASLVALEPAAAVRGVIDWYGPADLIAFARLSDPAELASTRESEWLGTTALAEPDLARRASPALQVATTPPPFLIAHGTADTLVPFEQSELLAEALRAAGGDVGFTAVPGADHMWRGVDDVAPIFAQAIAFAVARTNEKADSHAS